jgi:hypothetical protein
MPRPDLKNLWTKLWKKVSVIGALLPLSLAGSHQFLPPEVTFIIATLILMVALPFLACAMGSITFFAVFLTRLFPNFLTMAREICPVVTEFIKRWLDGHPK